MAGAFLFPHNSFTESVLVAKDQLPVYISRTNPKTKAHDFAQVGSPRQAQCELVVGRFSYSRSAPSHGRAFEYHRVGSSGRMISLRLSFSSLARIFFGRALTALMNPNFLCRRLEHRPCMPLKIPGRWTLVRTVWNYREN